VPCALTFGEQQWEKERERGGKVEGEREKGRESWSREKRKMRF